MAKKKRVIDVRLLLTPREARLVSDALFVTFIGNDHGGDLNFAKDMSDVMKDAADGERCVYFFTSTRANKRL